MSKNNYDFLSIQQNLIENWDINKIYEMKESNKEIFSVDTPPPTVSGNLHIGHIFSYTHTDFIVRYKRITGYEIFYPIGFDNNGLPTERFVEKETGIVSHSMERSEFIKLCLNFTEKIQEKFVTLFKTMGLSIDWRFLYSTISDETRKISQKNFIELYKKGYIYKKNEPVLFCTAFRTSVAQAELEEIEKETFFTTISFKLKNKEGEILIATTRPELLASCCAIFFNPDDLRYKNLENEEVFVPLYNKIVKILADDKVIIEKGTGLVMCCTFGDSLDVYWFKKHNFKFIQSIGIDGKMTELTEFLTGLSVNDARVKILEILSEKGFIKSQEKIKHKVSIYERSKKEIEYLVLSQWFVSLKEYKVDFLKKADEINWYPENMKQRYINWVENLQWDWCISRQRFYGIPFPVWYDENGNIILADEDSLPIDSKTDSPKNFNGKCFSDNDVMDTWNTSSLTPLICENLYKKYFSNSNNFFPMSIRPQAHDIIRTWAFDTIVKQFMIDNSIPWGDIVISGHVLSKEKEKISKSKGNNPTDPDVLISNYPVDAIRYWSASAKLGIDTAFSEDQLKLGNKLLVKLLNAAKFVQLNCENECLNTQDFNKIKNSKNTINLWVLNELKKTCEIYKNSFEKYEFSTSLNAIERFFWSVFCDDYLEIIKNSFFQPEKYSNDEIKETKEVLSFILKSILQLFSPFLIYLTEELYGNIFIKNSEKFQSLHLLNINETFDFLFKNFENKNYYFENFLIILSKIRKLKSDMNLSLKTEIENLNIFFKHEKEVEILKELDLYLKGVCSIKNINFFENKNSLNDELKTENEKYFMNIYLI